MQSPDAPTSLNLLAPNGIVRVQFPILLTAEQYSELLAVTEAAHSAYRLTEAVRQLGSAWGVVAVAEVIKKAPQQ